MTVLYDIANSRRVELGQGTPGFFSPDGKKMTWESHENNTPTVAVIDIPTGEQRYLGEGYAPSFFNNGVIAANTGAATPRESLLDVTTGLPLSQAQAGSRIFGVGTSDEPRLARARITGEESGRLTGRFTSILQVVDTARPAQALFSFEAFRSFVVDDDTILVAADPIVLEAPDRDPQNPRSSRLLTSLYLISVSRRTATYVSTMELHAQCWELVANRDYVVWQNGAPYPDQPDLMVYSRRTGSVTRVHSEFLPTLAYGGFYQNGLLYARGTAFPVIDLEAMSYFAILPQVGTWTADFRYASTGAIGGRDGPCFGQEGWP